MKAIQIEPTTDYIQRNSPDSIVPESPVAPLAHRAAHWDISANEPLGIKPRRQITCQTLNAGNNHD